jgi:BirA family biotin operon repressor/biotin-[acetyl-CoA-carboxylase] ligase
MRPSRERKTFHFAASAVALAACDAISKTTGCAPTLKWPNDVMIEEHKVGGMLAEIVENIASPPAPHRQDERSWPALVVGIGVNVYWPMDWPDNDSDPQVRMIAKSATTLETASGETVDREVLFLALLAAVEQRYGEFLGPHGPAAILADYRANCSTIGKNVRVELPDEAFDARAIGIEDDGRLLIERFGARLSLEAADIVHVRANPA